MTTWILDQAVAAGGLRLLDLHFARRMQRLTGAEEQPALLLAAALVSQAVGQGHVCLDLAELAATVLWTRADGTVLRAPALAPWREQLRRSPVVGGPDDGLPLVLDHHDRLYLARYHRFERDLAAALRARAGEWAAKVDRELLRAGLRRLFPVVSRDEIDWQQVAAAVAVLRPFSVISGGPGTGKTRTVAAILALLLEQAPGMRMALAAPTGKAAARLLESLRQARDELGLAPELAAQLPATAATLHRLLGVYSGGGGIPGTGSEFPRIQNPVPGIHRNTPRHDVNNPLPFDLLVVDEASMVDLPLMARLLDALRPETRLILLGDRDQLASVEAGRVLGDICGPGGDSGYSAEQCRLLEELTGARLQPVVSPPLADHVAVLRRSYRFGEKSGICAVARAVNAGDAAVVLATLRSAALADVQLMSPDAAGLSDVLRRWLVPRMRACLSADSPAACLQTLAGFRILAAVHEGPFGVRRINQLCEQHLYAAGLVDPRTAEDYRGRPVMISRNDYQLELFNGDTGLLLAAGEGPTMAWFDSGGAAPRAVAPSRLPGHETVYAMTVHKSQGSEFDELLLVLPEQENPGLTRELLYTAITRARRSLIVVARPEVALRAVQSRSLRNSGLYDALWGSGGEIRSGR